VVAFGFHSKYFASKLSVIKAGHPPLRHSPTTDSIKSLVGDRIKALLLIQDKTKFANKLAIVGIGVKKSKILYMS
jgi:hypothetical protein